MKTDQIIEELETASRKLGLEVRWEKGNFRGGRCTVAGRELIMLNKHHPPELNLAILADGLRDLPTDTVYLRPVTRDALQDAWQRVESIEPEMFDLSEDNVDAE